MLFRQLVLSAAIVLAISGCSDQPSGSDSTTPDTDNGSGNSTTSDSSTTPGSPTPPSTQPGSGGNVTPPALPTSRSTLTISGPVAGSQETDTYAFKVCSGQVCEQWQSTVAEGGFEYTFQLSQWPLDQIVTVEGSKLVSASANSARAFSNASVDAQSASYFQTELDTLTNILKMDSNDDGYIDQTELPTISLDPVTIAFNTVAKHLLQGELSNYGNLPYTEKNEAVRRYLSDNSKPTLVELNESQKKEIKNHIYSQSSRFYPRFFGSYTLALTNEQWAAIDGPLSTPQEQRVIELNTAQLRTLFTLDSNRPTTNNQFNLSVAQTYAVHGKLIYNQRLVIELAVLYQMLSEQSDIKLTIGGEQKTALNEQIALLNPDQQQATQFAGSYSIEIDASTLDKLGIYDHPNAEKVMLSFNAEQMRGAYQAYQQEVEDNGYADYVFTIKPMQWSRAGLSLEQIGINILAKAKTTPSYTLWQHYEKEILSPNEKPIIYNELENSIPAQLQKSYRYQWRANELVMANYNHPLKSSILAIAPERQLKISGRFPKELEQVSLSIILGSRRISDYDSSRYPLRHQPVNLITTSGQRQKSLDLSGESSFITTIALRNINNFYSRCAPGTLDKNAYEYTVYTADEMQDTLTIHLRDEKTGVELRSVLGSFCEIAKLDTQQGNSNGILEHDEFDRLSVGYVSTARAAMLLKSIVSRTGSLAYALPQTNEQIIEKYNQMPRKQVELLAAFLALQAKGKLFSSLVDLSERANLYDDLLALLNIDLSKYRVSDNNAYPSAETLLNRIASTPAMGQVLIENIDVNMSHIAQTMTYLLAESEADQYYFPSGVRPGGWVMVYPVNSLDASCQSLVDENQLLGLRIEGKGKDEAGHWVTIGWDSQPGASNYTLAWGEDGFSYLSEAQNTLPIEKRRATISGLDLDKQYYIRVQSNVGSASAQMTYSPRLIHIADSRATKGLINDDSSRGRDSSFACDPLTGKAENNNEDGLLGARYVKLDQQGKPLARQDLSYNTQPFACVVDAHNGLVWETKHRRKEEESYSVYDSDNQFLIQPVEGATKFSGTCTEHGTDKVSTEPSQCTVSNQIQWFNQEQRCGLSNWRLPTLQESLSILNFGNAYKISINKPANVDTQYFPHMQTMWLQTNNLEGTENLVLNTTDFSTYHKSTGLSNSLVLVSDGFYIEQ